ncbi:putative phosphoribosyl-AMP cyclohydrolase [Candidatus Hodgkinia cicadicola Dsem]|nr:putative phosphoribosyl-AMP cyclohydrolase [Candidatus Hodgkinia cicadicola Dsem]
METSTKLLPVVVTDWYSGKLLMLAYCDELCLNLTFHTGVAHYYSRSRQTIWVKGLSSGRLQLVQAVYRDCDGDALNFRVLVLGDGRVCHTRQVSCFHTRLW